MSAWTDVADGIRVRQSRLFQMNSGVLEMDGHAVLIDPGVLPSELRDIANVMDGASWMLRAGTVAPSSSAQ